MNKARYSVPENYKVQPMEVGGKKLFGIMRNDKEGVRWLWSPEYDILYVAKTFGKILIAYRLAEGGKSCLRISSYNKKWELPVDVYDVMFGENCLYVKVSNKRTGNIEWAAVNSELNGIKPLGDFEVVDRDSSLVYIPIGKTELTVSAGDTEKKLKLMSAELVDVKPKEPVRVEPIHTQYRVVINNEASKVEFRHPDNNRLLNASLSVGELEAYEPVIKAMIGNTDLVDLDVGDALIKFLGNFEHYVHGMVIPIIFRYVKDRASKDASLLDIIKEMDNEVRNKGWYKSEDGEIKMYMDGSIMLLLLRDKTHTITVAPLMIDMGDEENSVFSPEETQAIWNYYNSVRHKTVRVCIDTVYDYADLTDDSDVADAMLAPYYIDKILKLVKTIKSYRFGKISERTIKWHLDGNDKHFENRYGLCSNFCYTPKKNGKGEVSEVKTNVNSVYLTA